MARKILFEIEIENVGAARRIESLREEIRRLNKEIKGAEIGSPVYNELIARLTDAKSEVAQLREQQKQLNREFKATQVPKDSLAGLRLEYAKLTEQIKVLSKAERESAFGATLVGNAAKVKGEIDSIEQSLGRFTGNVGNYKSAFSSLAQILTGGLIGGGLVLTINQISQAFTKGLDEVQAYEAGLSRLSSITGVTGDQLEEFRKRAEGLTTIQIGDNQIVNRATDIFEAFTLVGSARPELLEDAAALEEVTKQAIILSKASGDDLNTSVEAITTTLGQFQLNATESKRVINELAAGSKLGASEIVDTTVALQKFGTTAAVANVSTSESIALIETLADRQLKGQEAGTQLRNILAKLAAADILPPKALIELEKAGVDLNVLKDTTVPLITRLQELGKLQGNTAALTKVFGLENLAAAQIITQGIPKYQELVAGIEGTNDAYEQAAINADNVTQRLDNLKNQGVNLLTQAFIAGEPVIEGIISLLSGFVEILSEAPDLISDNAAEFGALTLAVFAFSGTAQKAAAGALALATAEGRQAAATALSTVATNANTLATRALAAAQAALPLLAVVAGIYAIVKAFDIYEDSASASDKATRALADAQAYIAEESAKEVTALKQNIDVLKSDKTSKEDRKKAIDSLVQSYPEYLKNINLETASAERLNAVQNQLIESIIRQGIERRKNIELEKIDAQIIDERLNQERIRRGELNFSEKASVANAFALNALTGKIATAQEAQNALLDISTQKEQKLLNLRTEISKQFDAAKPQELVLVVPEKTKQAAKNLGDTVKEAGEAGGASIRELQARLKTLKDEFEQTAPGTTRFKELAAEIKKTEAQIASLTGKSSASKKELDAQAGSVAALKNEVSKLQKQVEATNPNSPAFAGLVKRLDEVKKKLKEAEKELLASTFKSLFGRELTAPALDTTEQPTLQVITELEPDAETKLKAQAQAAKDAIERDLQAVEFPVEVKPLSDAEKKFNEEIEKANKDRRDKEEKASLDEAAKREERIKQLKDAAIETAQSTASAVFEIQRNNAQRELDAKIAALDLETQNRIAAANGNKTKIAAIEKDAAAKREAIEKEAARERKIISIKEALINTALAITKALTGAPPPANFILAGVSAAAGLAQVAVIRSQEFAEGGVVDSDELIQRGQTYAASKGISIKRLQPGVIRERPNAPRTAKGDSVLAYLAPGEMVLNKKQQFTLRSLYGQDAFALAGVPGESKTRGREIPGFATGGIVGIVPQNGFAQNTQPQAVTVDVEPKFSEQQVTTLGQTMGTIIADLVAKGAFEGVVLGSDTANRAAERQAYSNQQRQG